VAEKEKNQKNKKVEETRRESYTEQLKKTAFDKLAEYVAIRQVQRETVRPCFTPRDHLRLTKLKQGDKVIDKITKKRAEVIASTIVRVYKR